MGYNLKAFHSFACCLFGFAGGPKNFPSRKNGQNDVEFELGNNALYLLMVFLELTISQMSFFNFFSAQIFNLKSKDNFIVLDGFVFGNFGPESLHDLQTSNYLYIKIKYFMMKLV